VTDGAVVMAFTLSTPAYEAFETMLMPFKDSTVRVAYEAGISGFELYNQLTPLPETSSGPGHSNAAIGFPNEQPARFSTCQEFDITFLLGMTSANLEIKVIRIFDS
jgi:hypothetical protein